MDLHKVMKHQKQYVDKKDIFFSFCNFYRRLKGCLKPKEQQCITVFIIQVQLKLQRIRGKMKVNYCKVIIQYVM